jgi:hypothetical protein
MDRAIAVLVVWNQYCFRGFCWFVKAIAVLLTAGQPV